MYTVRKDIECSGETEILPELVFDTARELVHDISIFAKYISRTYLCSISVSPLHFISFLTVYDDFKTKAGSNMH